MGLYGALTHATLVVEDAVVHSCAPNCQDNLGRPSPKLQATHALSFRCSHIDVPHVYKGIDVEPYEAKHNRDTSQCMLIIAITYSLFGQCFLLPRAMDLSCCVCHCFGSLSPL
eukprot:6212075-Amphidinium_carterae.1